MESLFVHDCVPRQAAATLFRVNVRIAADIPIDPPVRKTELKYEQQRMDL
jgi:hypothetical protein